MSASYLDELRGARTTLRPRSTAERVAALLREQITAGRLAPGTRLSEEEIGTALAVSRNTLREAFRLLAHERLLVHVLNRGVFVRELSAGDVEDLYRLRAIVECAALVEVDAPGRELGTARAAVVAGEVAAREGRWRDVGTANMAFHGALAGLADSARVDEIMDNVLAELRLVFAVMGDPERFHAPFLHRNRELLGHLERGEGARAAAVMRVYLADARDQLLAAYVA